MDIQRILICATLLISMAAPAGAKRMYCTPQDLDRDDAPTNSLEFDVSFMKALDGKLVLPGDKVECVLTKDLLSMSDKLIAPAGSKVYGHVEMVNESRGLMSSLKSKEERFKMHASVGIKFTKIVDKKGHEINIDGMPVKQISIFNNDGKYRQITVGTDGEVLKTESLEMLKAEDFNVMIPEQMVKMKGRMQVNILAGDHLKVIADLDPAARNVSATILKK